ncbi:hypothetical protein IFM89_017049 [Coptis chinensis]|uniref:Uncharacterized protein n=1 Tax=Coptis chinensis TaxID=261450 RepID=A0A835HML5_9MAGN|nr:hypothetical protein IFM89_017049 [Coptis chinensis]
MTSDAETNEEEYYGNKIKLIEPKLRYGGCLRHDQAEIAESKVECLKRGMDYVSDEASMSRTNQDAEDDEDDFIPTFLSDDDDFCTIYQKKARSFAKE